MNFVMHNDISSSSQVIRGSYANPVDGIFRCKLSASIEGPLLDDTGDASHRESDDHWGTPSSTSVTIPELLTKRELRRPLVVVSFLMISQQLSGLNIFLF